MSTSKRLDHLTIEPIKSEEMMLDLEEVARGDQHGVLFATHVVKKGGEIIGYCSLFSMPMVNIWMHSQKTTARDSVQGLNLLDTLARCCGKPNYLMCCSKSSPYFNLMDRFGFANLWETVIFQRKED